MTLEREHVAKLLADTDAQLASSQSGGRPFARRFVDAEARSAELRTRREELQQQIVQIDDRAKEADALRQASRTDELRRHAREEAAFWFRRFFTTLGIANAAAFAAIAGGFLQAEGRAPIAHPVAAALTSFAEGMTAAGAIPILLWVQFTLEANSYGLGPDEKSDMIFIGWVNRVIRIVIAGLLLLSAWRFFEGLGYAIGGVRGLAR